MKYALIIIILALCSSCWAPRCPIESCEVRMEHAHSDLVTGVFMGRYFYPPRLHYLWDKDKGESNPDTDFQPAEGKKPRGKLRKKFPWERW